MKARTWSWIAAVLVAAGALTYGSIDEGAPRTDSDRAYALAKDFACPVCQGQSVAESDVPVARTIRRNIAQWVDEGRNDEYIRQQLVNAFGEDIDYNPSGSGITAFVWIVPVVAGLMALAGLVVVFRRWGAQADLVASADDIALVEAARRGDQ